MYCPMCGTKIDLSEPLGNYSLDKARYLWERKDGGKIIFKKFRIVRDLGKATFSTTEPVRPNLGDFEHINLLNMRQFSFLYANPNQIYEIYNIGKLVGYYNVNAALSETNIIELVEKLTKTGVFWKIFNKINNFRRNTERAGKR